MPQILSPDELLHQHYILWWWAIKLTSRYLMWWSSVWLQSSPRVSKTVWGSNNPILYSSEQRATHVTHDAVDTSFFIGTFTVCPKFLFLWFFVWHVTARKICSLSFFPFCIDGLNILTIVSCLSWVRKPVMQNEWQLQQWLKNIWALFLVKLSYIMDNHRFFLCHSQQISISNGIVN